MARKPKSKPITIHSQAVEMRSTASLLEYPGNARIHPPEQIQSLCDIILDSGFTSPLLIEADGNIIAGHGRLQAAQSLGMAELPCVVVSGLSPAQIRALRLSDNALGLLSSWDTEVLAAEIALLERDGFNLDLTGFGAAGLAALLDPPPPPPEPKASGSLAERFGIAPFSVLNAREGWWQARKAAWLALGIKSEVGRGENLIPNAQGMTSKLKYEADADAERKRTAIPGGGTGKNSAYLFKTSKGYKAGDDAQENGSGTSIFDPVLCELAYRWFCPDGGKILDPFAGGSVRGVVAGKLGFSYAGIDLRPEQVAANEAQAREIIPGADVEWFVGDSAKVLASDPIASADFLFSCPPYGHLERYSDDPEDLSTMELSAFLDAYRDIVAKACARLRPDRFACFVVGDYRDKKGNYCDFVSETIAAFHAAGLHLYNQAVLVTPVGSLCIRAGRTFSASRKLGQTHQQVLVFVKGDWHKACSVLGPPEFGEISEEAPAPQSPPGADDDSKFGERL